MRKLFLLLVALAGFAPGATERLAKIGKPVADLSGGNTEIVVGADAPRTVRFAAAELKTHLDGVLRANIPIVDVPGAGKHCFYLGVSLWSKAAGIDDAKLFRDAFFIKNTPDGIFIVGRDDPRANPVRALQSGVWAQLFERGTLFGVYDWLERFAGVRFYFPGAGTIVPEKRMLAIPEADIFDFPDFKFRKISQYEGLWPGKAAADEARPEKNLANFRYRNETRYIPNCHGLARYGFLNRFGKTHPEYFALMEGGRRHCNSSLPHPGSLCYSSDVVEEIYQDAKSFLLGEPASKRGVLFRDGTITWDPSAFQPGYANIMPQDSYYRCQCEKCAGKFGSGVNYATEFMWEVAADIANRLKRENVPGYVTMMAYRPYRGIPVVEIPDNMLVMVAEIGPWGQYDADGQQRDRTEIAAWVNKIGHKVWLWNYLCKAGGTAFPGVPSPSAKSVAHYLKSVTPYIDGAYLESETDRYLNNYLVYYVFGKYAWNNRVDTEELIAEHHRLMFGAAAHEMAKIFDIFEQLWLTRIVGKQLDTERGPLVAPPSDYELWHEIYPAEIIDEVGAIFDRAEKLVAADDPCLMRVKIFRSEWLKPLAATRVDYLEKTDAVKHFSCSPEHPAWLIPFRLHPRTITQKPVSTEVSVKLINGGLTVVFDCEEPDFAKVAATKRKHDDIEIWRDNGVELFLNPSGDRINFYQLMLNSAGSFTDRKLTVAGSKSQGDLSWESCAEYRITPTPTGFRAEISLPEKSLPEFCKEGFPANFGRNRILSEGDGFDTLYIWSPFARGFQDFENYGTLKAVDEPETSILSNGDFSGLQRGRYFDGWFGPAKPAAKQAFELDREVFVSGSQSMRLESQDESGSGICLGQYLDKLKPDTDYEVSCYVKLSNVRAVKIGGGVRININPAGNLWFPKNCLTGSTDRWVRQAFRFKTSADTGKKNRPYIRIYLLQATGTVWFDDIKLEELPAP